MLVVGKQILWKSMPDVNRLVIRHSLKYVLLINRRMKLITL